MDEAFARFTLDEICARLSGHDIIHAPLCSLAETADSAAAQNAGCFPGSSGRLGRLVPDDRSGAPQVGRAAPKLGEHTREVLAAAGYRPAAIEELLHAGAAGQGYALGGVASG
jgi:crotonobetainyl-CoA:carnitine CoA-transferase CaiB-like acyl-CoA transferase